MTRRQAREQAFILIFEKAFQQDCTVSDVVANAVEACFFEPDEFAVGLASAVYDHLEDIDGRIAPCLKGWSAKRISKVSTAILRLSVCEMLFIDSVPVNVSINEAVELAKSYAGEDEWKFVNGVLGTVSRTLQREQEQAELEAKENEPPTLEDFIALNKAQQTEEAVETE